MTESEWLAATDPAPMLEALSGKASERKLRLFAVFCKREYLRFRPDVPQGIGTQYADATQKYADCLIAHEEWDGIRQFVLGAYHDADPYVQATRGITSAVCCCYTDDGDREAMTAAEHALLARVCRCLFGNPFRPVAFAPGWRTPTAVGLAQTIYDDRAFDRLPILADALQDAGCEDADVLAHVRGDGPHVRGCWVVDGVLGKS